MGFSFKRLLSSTSMRVKVLLAPGVCIFFIALSGMIILPSLKHQSNIANEIYTTRLGLMQESADIINLTNSANGNIYKYFMYRFAKYDTGMTDKLVAEQWPVLDQCFSRLESMAKLEGLSAEEKKIVEESALSMKEYREKAFEAVTTAAYDMNTGMVLMGMCDDQFVILSGNLSKLTDMQKEMSRKKIGSAKSGMIVLSGITVAIILVSLVVAVFVSIIVSRAIIVPVKRVTGILRDISEGSGDLTARIETKNTDEIGLMSSYFNRFVSNMQSIIKDVKDSSIQVASSAEEISSAINHFSENAQGQAASAEEISASVEEISANVSLISERSEEQYDSMSSLFGKLTGLSRNIEEMGVKLKETSELSLRMYGDAKAESDTLNTMSKSMEKMSHSSKEMINIVNIINDISEKINLLSLNAAIEAARAGEAGRGFAVVADEISKLADQTATSLSDIGKLIKSNEDEITTGLRNADLTMKTIGALLSGVETISEMIKTLNEYMDKQKDNNSLVNREISVLKQKTEEVQFSLTEQNAAMKEILGSITNISSLNQQTASGAEEMAASSESMAHLSKTLKGKVDFFNV